MIDSDSRPVQLVLDDSAIAGFVAGMISPGELLSEIEEGKGIVVIPLACMVQAASVIPDADAWLDFLLSYPAVLLVSDHPGQWRKLSDLQRLTGSYHLTVAARIAVDYDVEVLTQHPERYEPVGGGSFALPFDV